MFKPRSAEADPLLPQTDPSPEIQSYGTSNNTSSTEIKYNGFSNYPDDTNGASEQVDQPAPETRSSTKSSIWGTIVALFTCGVFFALVLMALQTGDGRGPYGPLFPTPPQRNANRTLDQRVSKILTDTPLIDGHNDLAIAIRGLYKNDINSATFKDKFENGGLAGQVDLPRLQKGMVGGAFWSAFVVCSENASYDFSDAEYSTSVAHTLQQIDAIKRLHSMYPSKFSLPTTSIADMLMRFRSSRTMFGPISIEGLHQVPQSAAMSTLRLYHQLGVRMATLTWNCHNAFADAALVSRNGSTKPAGYHRGGLTQAGRAVIGEMNRLGMLVDLSHTSYWTQKAVMSGGTSKSPVVFSHSSAYALCPHPRNVQDDILDLVKETNSVVQVNFSPDFISCIPTDGDLPELYKKNNTLHQVARHIIYIGEKIGYDHVGLGSDFDGIGTVLPEGLDGVDKFPHLVKELLKMGVSDSDASKIVGGNVLRVWRAAETVAHTMQRDGAREGEDIVRGQYAQNIMD